MNKITYTGLNIDVYHETLTNGLQIYVLPLPKFVNKKLLISWIENMQTPQNELLENIIASIEDNGVINAQIKEKLAQTVRKHYKKHPYALKYQASGNTIPNTVDNHKI